MANNIPKDWKMLRGNAYPWRVELKEMGARWDPGARPMDWHWAKAIKDQCVAAGVPFFFKQAADAQGRKIHLPKLDGQHWIQYPERP